MTVETRRGERRRVMDPLNENEDCDSAKSKFSKTKSRGYASFQSKQDAINAESQEHAPKAKESFREHSQRYIDGEKNLLRKVELDLKKKKEHCEKRKMMLEAATDIDRDGSERKNSIVMQQLKEGIDEDEEEISDYNTEKIKIEAKVKHVQIYVDEQKKQLDIYETKLEKLESQIHDTDCEFENLKEEHDRLCQEDDNTEREISNLEKMIQAQKRKRSENEDLRNENNRKRRKLKKREKSLEKQFEDMDEKRATFDQESMDKLHSMKYTEP